MGYTIPDVKLAKQVIHTAYGMSFAKAYALCRDAGLGKADAESCLWHLAQGIHEERPIGADAIRAHLILERANQKRGVQEGAL